MSGPPPALALRLRAETHEAADRLRRAPVFAALTALALPDGAYLGLLRSLLPVYAEVERCAPRAGAASAPFRKAWRAAPGGCAFLRHEIARSEVSAPPDRADSIPQEALLGGEVAAQGVRYAARRNPLAVLGHAFVLYAGGGSGGDALLPEFPRSERFPPLLDAALDSVPVDDGDAVVAAANTVLAEIEPIASRLLPVRPTDPQRLATVLNPSAGVHAVPADMREVAASLTAGERTWARFAYYEMRYGERGRAFTRSDSAWLATVTGCDQNTTDRQVRWLAALLAGRGMPRWLMEVHLTHQAEELTRAVPEKAEAWARLAGAARMLREARTAVLPDEAGDAVAAHFIARVGSEWAGRLPEAGRLVAAAVADAGDGVPRAVESLVEWLTEPERFPAEWAEAVRAAVEEGRAAARG